MNLQQTTWEMGGKHYCNLNDSTFKKFIHECEGNYVGKSLF